MFGLHDPVQSGLACGSDTAHMNIFGYNPLKLYDGRGSFEAMGAGMQMNIGDIAFKCNFAFMNLDTRVVERRRVDRTFADWGVPLCDLLNNVPVPGYPDHTLWCSHATEHRCGVRVSGPRLSSLITGTDPLKDNLPIVKCKPENSEDEDAIFTCELIEAVSNFITKTLLEAPICVERRSKGLTYPNMITLRGAG